MAVVLKRIEEKVREKRTLKLVPTTKTTNERPYEFPYDDMYLLYDYIQKTFQEN
ncbi:MAG: hypothetical protein PWP44_10 [Thermacetogenium sp.]|jgi:hypothetical protein|uniref:Uncharacterized protein n=1 Tax=Thermacetogenium phaeum TaxID=85874 RepID=A0A101FHH2_9THEO|nr:MAG: Uncharacterized protein XD66_0187 [Thermacetogenium phaeum]MDN5364807.1 hypothetical protein [Thermacetogenium sp.]